MKIRFISVIITCLLISCSNSDDGRAGNPFLPDVPFDTGDLININLPQFSQLQFPGNSLELNNFGINGVILYSSGTTFSAFELSDPNHQLNTCSNLTVDNAIATCNCEDANSYNIINGGQVEGTTGQFGLVPYAVEVNGNIIRVFNN